jgi:hypothetical protein
MGVALSRPSATAGAPRVWSPGPCHEVERLQSSVVQQGSPCCKYSAGHSPEKDEAAGVQLTLCVHARGVL